MGLAPDPQLLWAAVIFGLAVVFKRVASIRHNKGGTKQTTDTYEDLAGGQLVMLSNLSAVVHLLMIFARHALSPCHVAAGPVSFSSRLVAGKDIQCTATFGNCSFILVKTLLAVCHSSSSYVHNASDF